MEKAKKVHNLQHLYMEPMLFVSIALLAGTKRYVKYFPNTSRGGLLYCAGLTGVSTFSYDIIRNKNLIEKEAVVIMAALGSAFLAQPHIQRFCLSLSGSIRMGGIQSIIVLGKTLLFTKIQKPVPSVDFEKLSDQEKHELLLSSVTFYSAFDNVIDREREAFPPFDLNMRTLRMLKSRIVHDDRVAEIANHSFRDELNALFDRFNVPKKHIGTFKKTLTRVLVKNEKHKGFLKGNTWEGQEERKRILYGIYHVLYAYKRLSDSDIDEDTQEKVKLCLQGFKRQVARNYCKQGWIDSIQMLDEIFYKSCDCNSCALKTPDPRPQLQRMLEQRLIKLKKEAFSKTVLEAYGGTDRQPLQTIPWYAKQLPELEVHDRYVDRLDTRNASTSISAQRIKALFLERYSRELVTTVKNLLSYGPGSDDIIRDEALRVFCSLLQEEAEKENIHMTHQQASDILTQRLWDEDDFQIKDSIVFLLLEAYDYLNLQYEANPELCDNGESLRGNMNFLTDSLTK